MIWNLEVVIVPDATTTTLPTRAKSICEMEYVIVNLYCSHATDRPTFCTMTIWHCVQPVIMPCHESSAFETINAATGSIDPIDGVVFNKPKFIRAVIWKISP